MSVAVTEFDRMIGRPRQLAIDPVLTFAVAGLMLLGIVMVASASMSVAEKEYGSAIFYLQRHGAHLLIGLVVGLFTLGVPSAWWRFDSAAALVLAFALLLVVLLPGVGHEVNGSVRWIRLGSPSRICQSTAMSTMNTTRTWSPCFPNEAQNERNVTRGLPTRRTSLVTNPRCSGKFVTCATCRAGRETAKTETRNKSAETRKAPISKTAETVRYTKSGETATVGGA